MACAISAGLEHCHYGRRENTLPPYKEKRKKKEENCFKQVFLITFIFKLLTCLVFRTNGCGVKQRC